MLQALAQNLHKVTSTVFYGQAKASQDSKEGDTDSTS